MNLLYRIKRRHQINRAVRQLSSLSDQILLDIGVERGNIAELVEQMIDSNISSNVKVVPAQGERVRQKDYQVTSGATA